MLLRETGDAQYKEHWDGFVDAWTSQKGNSHVVTSPQGWVARCSRPRGGWRCCSTHPGGRLL
jgi:hypothetical protein